MPGNFQRINLNGRPIPWNGERNGPGRAGGWCPSLPANFIEMFMKAKRIIRPVLNRSITGAGVPGAAIFDRMQAIVKRGRTQTKSNRRLKTKDVIRREIIRLGGRAPAVYSAGSGAPGRFVPGPSVCR